MKRDYTHLWVVIPAAVLFVALVLAPPSPALSEGNEPAGLRAGGGATALASSPQFPSESAKVIYKAKTHKGLSAKRWAGIAKDRWETIQALRRALNAVSGHSVIHHAMRLASAIWNVSYRALVSVGKCESGLNPGARNGQYRGIFQEGPMFERGPFGSFSVWDVYANVFTAAHTVSRQGWSQWECKP